jgi:four helix bundle protein
VCDGGQFEDLLGNPKTEIRMPKEIRNPKSESRRSLVHVEGGTSALWDSDDGMGEGEMTLREGSPGERVPPHDLMERTAQLGEAVIRFAKNIPQNPVNNRLISQLVAAATSIGANYCEADDAVSGKDFKLRIGTCRKESKETMFFLRMIASAEESLQSEARRLWREAKELNLIFGAIWRKK